MNEWRIEYDNDTGYNDETFLEWWTVTNGEKAFKCSNSSDADWLREVLNDFTTNP